MLTLQIPINSKGNVFEYELDQVEVTIGRRHDNDIRIKESYISAYHAELTCEDDTYFLRDRDSANGTFVNGDRILRKTEIFEGDVIKLGSLRCFVVESGKLVSDDKSITLGRTPSVSESTFTKEKRQEQPTDKVSVKSPKTERLKPETKSKKSEPAKPVTEIKSNSISKDAEEIKRLKEELAKKNKELSKTQNELLETKEKLVRTEREAQNDESAYCDEIADLKKQISKEESAKAGIRKELEDFKSKATDGNSLLETTLKEKEILDKDKGELEKSLKTITSERDETQKNFLLLEQKLKDTQKDYSSIVDSTQSKLEKTSGLKDEFAEKFEKSKRRADLLDSELKSLREDFSRMEKSYQEKIKSEQDVCEKLEKKVDHLEVELKESKSKGHLLDSQVVELKKLNSNLLGHSSNLDEMRTEIEKSKGKVDDLQTERFNLQKEAENLRIEKEKLSNAARQAMEEMEICEENYQGIKQDCEHASHRLDTISQRLRDSEKKVAYLRSLEIELEKSVLRAQRSALSRRGIYSEEETEEVTIWPETEQMICRELIERIELLEDLLKRYQQSWFFPNVADQLNILRESFMTLLKNHSVDQFDLEPGTILSVDSRKKIQLISVEDFGDPRLKKKSARISGDRTTVIETVRPGYIYNKGGEDVIIRKAEVIVA